ncbi:uncharacterized protein LOC131950507 [Physella acuta]|uniref:uncharacterized protein LOC131950507 n=1 Tax=Physella acuta TaxID=109671 RepID=UPI0027DC7516|nr:uncharacterized protein LOC131950507 [Physella acuta]
MRTVVTVLVQLFAGVFCGSYDLDYPPTLGWGSNLAATKPSAPNAPSYTSPSKASYNTPVLIDPSQLDLDEYPIYTQPANSNPRYDTLSNSNRIHNSPSNPIYNSPSNPSYNSPSNPIYNSPSNPSYNSPSNPSYNSPSNPSYNSPSNPSYNSPSNPSYNSPSNPIYNSPSNPSYNSPSNPSYNSPSNPSYNSPSNPSYNSPSNPSYNSPSNPSYNSPSNPSYNSPSNPSYNSPSNPSYNSPSSASYNNAAEVDEYPDFLAKMTYNAKNKTVTVYAPKTNEVDKNGKTIDPFFGVEAIAKTDPRLPILSKIPMFKKYYSFSVPYKRR